MRHSTCWTLTPNPTKDCQAIPLKEQEKYKIVSIYDADGSIWLKFRIWHPQEAGYFEVKDSFSPLYPSHERLRRSKEKLYGTVVMRLSKESPSWYQVEVNEKTRETKFILKSDPVWAKVDWTDIFNESINVLIDPARTKLLETPNGKPLTNCSDRREEHRFSRLEGDWMLVNQNSTCEGWVRWRNGRDILVGSLLNDQRIPQVEGRETP
ncbi:MAG: hypothetical protein AB7F88_03440 [Pyrinomonadaceae bacterium]